MRKGCPRAVRMGSPLRHRPATSWFKRLQLLNVWKAAPCYQEAEMESVHLSTFTLLSKSLWLICPSDHPGHVLSHPKPWRCIRRLSHFHCSYWLLSMFLTAGYPSFPHCSGFLFSGKNRLLIEFRERNFLSKTNHSICALDYLSPLELLLCHLSPSLSCNFTLFLNY